MLVLLKYWHWFALAGLALALAFFFNLATERGSDLQTRTAERDAAVKSANDWQATYQQAQALAEATAKAHSVEQTALINMARAVGSTKEGIAHAPGASDHFTYSDAAYGFMRDAAPAPAAAGSAAQAAAGVDKH